MHDLGMLLLDYPPLNLTYCDDLYSLPHSITLTLHHPVASAAGCIRNCSPVVSHQNCDSFCSMADKGDALQLAALMYMYVIFFSVEVIEVSSTVFKLLVSDVSSNNMLLIIYTSDN